MKILNKKATVLDANSKHHKQCKDLLIENGIILKIDEKHLTIYCTNKKLRNTRNQKEDFLQNKC